MENKINVSISNKAFSFVEIVSVVALIGIVTFLAVPNIVNIRTKAEKDMAIARVASLNMALSSAKIQLGSRNLNVRWQNHISSPLYTNATISRDIQQGLYREFILPNLSAGTPILENYLPQGYNVLLPNNLSEVGAKIRLFDGSDRINTYNRTLFTDLNNYINNKVLVDSGAPGVIRLPKNANFDEDLTKEVQTGTFKR